MASPRLKLVRAIPPTRLHLVYSDSVEGEINIAELIGRGVFASLSDPAIFVQASIGESGEVYWPGGADLCGDALYLQITGKTPEDVTV